MKTLRQLAKGQPCMIRAPGICNFDNSTTVLCHLNVPGTSGMGMKSKDLVAVLACSRCHDALDMRAGKARITDAELKDAIAWTLDHWISSGLKYDTSEIQQCSA